MSENFYDSEMAARQERMAQTPDMARQRAALLERLDLSPGEAVLELGTGNGILARDMAGRIGPGGRVVGIDSSEAILGMARHFCPDAEFRLADAQDLPFRDASFDAVVAAQVLCFLPDVPRALAEVARVLKPGGRAVLLDTDWGTLVWRSSDPVLMARVMAAYAASYADDCLPRRLAALVHGAGLAVTQMDSLVILNRTFDEDTYARQTAGFALPIMDKSGGFSESDRDRWLRDQEALDRDGAFFFSLNRYIVTAYRPG